MSDKCLIADKIEQWLAGGYTVRWKTVSHACIGYWICENRLEDRTGNLSGIFKHGISCIDPSLLAAYTLETINFGTLLKIYAGVIKNDTTCLVSQELQTLSNGNMPERGDLVFFFEDTSRLFGHIAVATGRKEKGESFVLTFGNGINTKGTLSRIKEKTISQVLKETNLKYVQYGEPVW